MTGWFLHPGMLAGLALVSVPIIIHLIHRLRFRRVRWAAMEFLLDSHRRNRRRVLLEQLLLLALRCLLVALVVAMIARPILGEDLASLLSGGATVDYFVLLDDSLSMQEERTGSPAPFDRAKAAVKSLVANLATRPGQQRLTLLKSSTFSAPEFTFQKIDAGFLPRVASLVDAWQPTALSSDLTEALRKLSELVESSDGSTRQVLVMSDYRAKDFVDNAPLGELCQTLTTRGAKLHLVTTTADAPGKPMNLTVEQLTARTELSAVNVPFKVLAKIRNWSDRPMEQVQLVPTIAGKPAPTVILESIPAGETAEARFDVLLTDTKVHDIQVQLTADALAGDNVRHLAVQPSASVPILIVDGGAKQLDSLFLKVVLAPGGAIQTGISPVLRTPAELEAVSLADHRAVILANIGPISKEAIRRLRDYVSHGGGLGVFVGDQDQPEALTRLLGTGEDPDPLLPIPLLGPVEPERDTSIEGPDLTVEPHPIFSVFAGQRASLLDEVRVFRFLKAGPTFTPTAATKILARFRDGSPIVLESSVGSGRCLLFLTTAGPGWNSWPKSRSYPIAVHELVAYLAETSAERVDERVGSTWTIAGDASRYRREATLLAPAAEKGSTQEIPVTADPVADAGSQTQIQFTQTGRPGVYQLTRATIDGVRETTGRAFNIEPTEGNLTLASRDELDRTLGKTPYQWLTADSFQGDLGSTGFNPQDWILVALALVLLAEQLLAYRLSYHLR